MPIMQKVPRNVNHHVRPTAKTSHRSQRRPAEQRHSRYGASHLPGPRRTSVATLPSYWLGATRALAAGRGLYPLALGFTQSAANYPNRCGRAGPDPRRSQRLPAGNRHQARHSRSAACGSAPASPDLGVEPAIFALPDAIAFGLRNNPRFRSARAAIERARGQEQVAFAPFLPQIDLLGQDGVVSSTLAPGIPGNEGFLLPSTSNT